jgi:hypothetical protein
MNVIRDTAPGGGADRVTLLMLPAAGGRAEDFVERGFVGCLRRRGLPVDVLAVDARFDDYLEGAIAGRIESEVVQPARAGNAQKIWLMGISLGGLGALAHARAHGGVEGVVLLAPFLGSRGLVAEVTRAGGLAQWQPGTRAPDDPERLMLEWLGRYRAGDPAAPRIYLAYGAQDRYAPASAMLEPQLPREHVVSLPGGHDWATWLALWERLLDGGLFLPQHAAAGAR